jgi:hypothetical protein
VGIALAQAGGEKLSRQQGTSINQFVATAVAEKDRHS